MGSLDPAREDCIYACLLPKHGGGGGLKTAAVAAQFTMTIPGQDPDRAEQMLHLNLLHDAAPSRAGAVIMGMYTGNSSKALWVLYPSWTTRTCALIHVPTPPLLAPALFPSGVRVMVLGVGESTNLEGMEPAWTRPSRFLLQQFGIKIHPQ